MFSPEQMDSLLKEVMKRMSGQGGENNTEQSGTSGNVNNYDGKQVKLTPAKLLVITGILGGVFEVDSVLMNKNQLVQIVLAGSLKRKTQLEKILDHIGDMPFDEVVKTFLNRL